MAKKNNAKTDKNSKKQNKIIKSKKIDINNNYRSEEQEEIIRFIKIIIIVLVLVLGVYLFSRIFVSKDLFNKKEEEKTPVSGTINYSATLIGSMLNKPEDEYYVIIYNTESTKAAYYSNIVSTYKQNKNPLKVYMADLNNELNKKFIGEKNNLEVNDINDFMVNEIGLIKISKGKISKTFDSDEDISKELKYIKDTSN